MQRIDSVTDSDGDDGDPILNWRRPELMEATDQEQLVLGRMKSDRTNRAEDRRKPERLCQSVV